MAGSKYILIIFAEKIVRVLNQTSNLLTAKRIRLYGTALAIVSCAIFFKLNVYSATAGRNPGADFVQFYSAAILARVSPDKIYDAAAQKQVQRQFSAGAFEGIYWPYLHAPFFTVILIPLSYLPYVTAYWVWTGITILLYILSVILLSRYRQPRQPPLTLVLPIACAAPVLYWLIATGQTTAFALFTWTLGFYLLKRNRIFWSTFVLGFLFYRAQYLMALVPLFLIRRTAIAILGMATSCLALIVLGGLAFSFHSYAEYVNSIAEFSQRIVSQAQPLMYYVTLYGFFRPLFPHLWAITLTITTSLLLVYWLAKTWRKTVPFHSDAFDLQYAIMVTTTLLLMHHGFVYDLILLSIPALLIYPYRSLFSPHYKIVLTLIYFIPYIMLFFNGRFYFNPIQPLLVYLCFEIYRAYTRMDRTLAMESDFKKAKALSNYDAKSMIDIPIPT